MSRRPIIWGIAEKVPYPVYDYADYPKDGRTRVGSDTINDVTVSTVFLAVDHQYGDGPPVLFETIIFGGEHNEEQWRYCTWEEAEKGHQVACELVRQSQEDKP